MLITTKERAGARPGWKINAGTRIATNAPQPGSRFAIATTVHNQAGQPVASITLVGRAGKVQPRAKKLGRVLLGTSRSWPQRSVLAREAIIGPIELTAVGVA